VDGLRAHVLAWAGPPAGGTPLVLVHGLGVSSRYMIPLAGILAASRPVYAPDIPGFGRSAKPRRTLGVPGQADFLASWMAAAGLERAAFLGHSLGSQGVADLASRRPGLVERLVLAAPTIDDSGRTVPGEVLRLLLDVPREPFSLIPVVMADYLRAGPVRIFRTLRHALADRVEEKLPAIGMPALVMRGERDPVVRGPWAEKVRRLLPRGRLAVIPRAGHALQFGFPRETAAAVAAFLAEE
jgi:2-hydroxy-6-oxonona-2,4-dienedioate hydrolase